MPFYLAERDQIRCLMAVKDDLLARGLIRPLGYVVTRNTSGLWGIDFSKAMTPKWKRLVRYWTRERHYKGNKND